MADKGKRDKGKREQQKTAKLTPKEKRKQKKDKKKEKRESKTEQVNAGTAFWKKPKGSLKKKDYNQFYKFSFKFNALGTNKLFINCIGK